MLQAARLGLSTDAWGALIGCFVFGSTGGDGCCSVASRARCAQPAAVGGSGSPGGGTIVVLGEPGIGKTALIEQAVTSAPDFGVLRTAGREGELELAFAALQQLCSTGLDRLERPRSEPDALSVVFGLSSGDPPDRFLVALAVLTLLSELAADQPLLCVVDDAQWLDQASAQALGFVSRRLVNEAVAFLFGAPRVPNEVRDHPEMVVEGLTDGNARTCLIGISLSAR